MLKCNVLGKEELIKTTKETLESLHDILIRSYGPKGSNTIIRKGNDVPIVTKDGFTILNRIIFEDSMSNDIHHLIKKVSNELVLKVGDGSTSAIIAARRLYDELIDLHSKYPIPAQFNKYVDTLQRWMEILIRNYMVEELPMEDYEKRLEILQNIASLSNNNNKELGKTIGNIVSKFNADSAFNIELNPFDSEGIDFRATYGFKCNKDYTVHPIMYSDGNKTISLHNPIVFTCYSFNEYQKKIVDTFIRSCEQKTNKKPNIVIISEYWHPDLLKEYQFDFVRPESDKNIIPINVRNIASEYQQDFFNDLNIYLGCEANIFTDFDSDEKLANIDKMPRFIGNARLVTIDKKGIVFEGGAGSANNTEEFTTHLKNLQDELDNTPEKHISIRGNLRGRIERLNGIHCTIYVGGRTSEEKESLKYLVEDSVLACQSVMKYGYTIGGNYAPMYVYELLKEILNNPDLISSYDLPEEVKALVEEVKSYTDLEELRTLTIILDHINHAYVNINTPFISLKTLDILNHYTPKREHFENPSEYRKVNTGVVNILTNNLEGFYDTKIIAPMKTDTEIMKASFSILGLLLNSNSYIF